MKNIVVLLLSIVWANETLATEIESILVHPLFDKRYSCSEHAQKELSEPGDALGADCVIFEFSETNGRKWLKSYKGNGHSNSDWYGWQKNVLAPISGKVVKINLNSKTNKPGIMGQGPASYIILEQKDGTMVLVAHVENVSVKQGEAVERGQVIAKVGNNGQSRHPHIHIGAWRNKAPLQIRFDQSKIYFD